MTECSPKPPQPTGVDIVCNVRGRDVGRNDLNNVELKAYTTPTSPDGTAMQALQTEPVMVGDMPINQDIIRQAKNFRFVPKTAGNWTFRAYALYTNNVGVPFDPIQIEIVPGVASVDYMGTMGASEIDAPSPIFVGFEFNAAVVTRDVYGNLIPSNSESWLAQLMGEQVGWEDLDVVRDECPTRSLVYSSVLGGLGLRCSITWVAAWLCGTIVPNISVRRLPPRPYSTRVLSAASPRAASPRASPRAGVSRIRILSAIIECKYYGHNVMVRSTTGPGASALINAGLVLISSSLLSPVAPSPYIPPATVVWTFVSSGLRRPRDGMIGMR